MDHKGEASCMTNTPIKPNALITNAGNNSAVFPARKLIPKPVYKIPITITPQYGAVSVAAAFTYTIK